MTGAGWGAAAAAAEAVASHRVGRRRVEASEESVLLRLSYALTQAWPQK